MTTYPNLQGYSQFGFGRRTCQGLPIVEQDLFLTMGGMAWALNICKKRDAAGKEIPVHWDDYTPLLIAKPVRFQFDALVRDPEKTRLVTEMFADLDDTLCESVDGKSEKDFCTNAQDTLSPPPGPHYETLKRRRDSLSADESGLQHVRAEKGKRGSVSAETWTDSPLGTQGHIVVR